MNQVLVQAGLIASENQIQAELVQSALAQSSLSAEKQKAILIETGLMDRRTGEIITTKACTKEELLNALATKGVTGANAEAIVSALGLTGANKGLSFSFEVLAGSIKQTMLAMAMNPMTWIMVIPAIIAGITKLADALITTEEELKEARQKAIAAAETAKSEFDDINNELQNNKNTINDISKRYAELAQEVKNVGTVMQSQGTLSTEEYEEFLELGNQISDIFPALKIGATKSGDAILSLSGNVDTITNSINDAIDASERLAVIKLEENMDTITAGYRSKINSNSEDGLASKYNNTLANIENLKEELGTFEKEFEEELGSLDDEFASKKFTYFTDTLDDIFDDMGYDLDSYWHDGYFDFSEWSDTDYAALLEGIKNGYAKKIDEAENNLDTIKKTIDSDNKEYAQNILTVFQYKTQDLDDVSRQIFNSYVSNLNYDTLLAENDLKDFDDIESWLNTNILEKLRTGMENHGDEILSYFNKLLSIDPDAALAENIPLIEEYINKLSELFDIDAEQIQVAFGIDLNAYEDLFTQARDKLGYNDNPSSEAEEKHNQEILNFLNTLSESDLFLIIDADIPDDTIKGTKNDWLAFIEDLKASSKIDIQVNPTTPLSSISDAYSSLEPIFEDIQNGTSVAADSIEALNDAFGALDGGTALQEFKDTLTTMSDDTEAQQEALNKLATAYLDNSDLIQNLTEDNADYVKSELEKINVINADEVVQSRLTDQTDYLSQAQQEQDLIIRSLASRINSEADAKYYASLASIDLQNATLDDIGALIAEANAAGKDTSALTNYAVQLIKANNTSITTDGDIKNLVALADQLSGTTELAGMYTRMKAAAAAGRSQEALAIEKEIKSRSYSAIYNAGKTQNTVVQYSPPSDSTSTSTTSGSTTSSSAADETKTTIDWAERRLSAISQLVDDIKDSISHLSDFNTQNDTLNKAFRQLQSNLGIQKSAYDKYMEYANTQYNTLVKLYGSTQANNIKNAIADGTILISEYKSDAADIIQTYIDWYDKAQDVLDTMQDTKDELYEINQMKLDNIKEMYDIITNLHDTRISEAQASLDYRDAAGGSLINQTQADLYKKQLEETQYHLKKIEEEKAAYSKELEAQYKSGYISGADYQEGLTYLSELNAQIWQLKTSAVEYQQAIDSIDLKALEIEADTYQNLYDRWESVISLAAAKKSLLTTEDGAVASAYRHQIEKTGHQLQNLEKQLAWYQSALKNVSYGSQLWTDYSAEIADIQVQINDTLADQESIYDELIQLELNGYDKLTGKLDAYKSALTGLEGLLADEMLLTDDGHLTGYGIAKLTMLSEQYDVLNDQIKTYSDELKQIDEMYADRQDGYSEDEYLEDRQTAVNSILSSMSEMQSLTSDLITLRKSQMDKELSALEAVIAAREEAYEKKKEYYDYDKSIRTKTKDIQSIEAQIAALQATEDSLEKRRQLLALQEELKDAQTDLSETQTEHTYTVIVEGLDTFKNDLSDQYDAQIQTLKSSFEAQRKMIDEVTNLWASCGGIVNDVIKQIGTFYGVDISQYTSDTGFEDLAGFAGGGIIRSNRKTTGDRLLVRVNPLETILTEDFTKLLPDAVAVMSEFIKPNINLPDYTNSISRNSNSIICEPQIAITVQGNADDTTVANMKKMMSNITKQVTREIVADLHKSGY